jgi:succinoglycan biosynthesis protein ExoL
MKSILILAGDLTDAAQLRRIYALQSIGHNVQIIGFRKSDKPVTCIGSHLDLGQIANEHLTLRLLKISMAVPVILRFMRQQSHFDLIYARNLDMLFLAWIIRCLTWLKFQIFYEVLDIHGIFTNGGLKQHLARALERFLLRRVSRLVMSSPDFISQYFNPTQGFDGDWVLLENKIWQGVSNKVRPSPKPLRQSHKIRVGWVGNIRCEPSFEILMKLADQMENVEIHIHGRIHKHALRHFDHHVAARQNVFFHGCYEYPAGLCAVYRDLDVVWAQDLWQTGANSNWLLPNRIYEAAWHGCPCVCVAGTATARWVTDHDTGYVIENERGVMKYFSQLSVGDFEAKRQQILTMDPNLFCMQPSEIKNAITCMQTNGNRLPDFVCVGAMRAGTTALYDYCAQHPEIGVSAVKETDFFVEAKNWHRGVKWYKGLFPAKPKVCGEFSPNYTKALVFPNVPERMHAMLPNAKIIYIVRHPVDRAISQYNHAFLSGQNPPELAHLMGSHEWAHLIDTSCYNRQINLFLRYYHPSQLLVLNFDDVVCQPVHTLAKVAEFLGVSKSWKYNLRKSANSSKSLANLPKPVLRTANLPFVMAIKPYFPRRLRGWIKTQLETQKTRIPPIFPDTIKRAMWMDMEADIREFSKLTGIQFSAPVASPQVSKPQSTPRTNTA